MSSMFRKIEKNLKKQGNIITYDLQFFDKEYSSRDSLKTIFGENFGILFKRNNSLNENVKIDEANKIDDEDISKRFSEILSTVVLSSEKNKDLFSELGSVFFEDYLVFKYENYIGSIHSPSLTLDKLYEYDFIKQYFIIPENEIKFVDKTFKIDKEKALKKALKDIKKSSNN